MNRALAYLIFAQFTGSIRFRLQRLKQPKYLLGLLGLFLYFGLVFSPAVMGQLNNDISSLQLREKFGNFGGFVVVLFVTFQLSLTWIFAAGKGSLGFTEAESEILFAAPVSKRELLHFRLGKNQPSIFISALFITAFWSVSRNHPPLLQIFISLFVLINVLNMFGLFAVMYNDWSKGKWFAWPLRLMVLVVLLGPFAVAFFYGARDPDWIVTIQLVAQNAASGEGWGMILSPHVYLGNLPFEVTFFGFVGRLAGVGLLVLLLYYLIVSVDVDFFERELSRAKERTEMIQAFKRGRMYNQTKEPIKDSWFRLAPEGAPWRAVVWKNFLAFSRRTSKNLGIFLTLVIASGVGLLFLVTKTHEALMLVGVLLCVMAMFVTFLGSRFTKEDLRTDLENIDLLKMLPVPPAQIIRGEIYGASIPTSLGLFAMMVAAGICFGVAFSPKVDLLRLAIVFVSGALMLPALNILGFALENGLALAFPAWMLPGKNDEVYTGGFEQIGQSVITMLVKTFAFFALVLPPAFFYLFALLFTSSYQLQVMTFGAALVFAALILLEVELLILYMSHLFEELDPSSEGLS